MYEKIKLSVILSEGYAYSRGYVYCFCQMFQGLRLLKGVRLFRSLEYSTCAVICLLLFLFNICAAPHQSTKVLSAAVPEF